MLERFMNLGSKTTLTENVCIILILIDSYL